MKTLTNSFHNTSTRTRSALEWQEIAEDADLARRNLTRYRTKSENRAIALHRRIKNALCGSADCQCGTVR